MTWAKRVELEHRRSTRAKPKNRRLSRVIFLIALEARVQATHYSPKLWRRMDQDELDPAAVGDILYLLARNELELLSDRLRDNDLKLGRNGHGNSSSINVSGIEIIGVWSDTISI